MRVGIANDLRTAVEILRRVVTSLPEHSIAWVAANGEEAVQCCRRDTPDVVLMDLVMPVVDGAEATRRIMSECPCPVLIVTSDVTRNFQLVCQAMGHGAYDAICLPQLGLNAPQDAGADLLARLAKSPRVKRHLLAGGTTGVKINKTLPPAPQSDSSHFLPGGLLNKVRGALTGAPVTSEPGAAFPLVAIGSSTGGPQALDAILSRLPRSFPGAIVIAQHIGPEFAESLASWLQERSKIQVRTLKVGDRPAPGVALIGATADHVVLRKDRTFGYTAEPADAPYRPSVNALFYSLSVHWPQPGVAVLLTGIGNDGAHGMLALRQANWLTIAQDEASSVVYGMPQAAKQLNAAMRIFPVHEMADYLTDRLTSPRLPNKPA
jgi:two-component system, chemotaxis family, response regulator WspF